MCTNFTVFPYPHFFTKMNIVRLVVNSFFMLFTEQAFTINLIIIIIIIITITIKPEFFTQSLSFGVFFYFVMNEIIIMFFAICGNLFALI